MYIAQLTPLPLSLCRSERPALGSIIRLPGCSLALKEFFLPRDWHGPKLRSVQATADASMIRTANVTVPCWQELVHQLHADGSLPLVALIGGPYSLPHWDAGPYAQTLRRASTGANCKACFQNAIAATVIEATALQAQAELDNKRFQFQRHIHEALFSLYFAGDIAHTVARRAPAIGLPPPEPQTLLVAQLHLK